MRVGLVEDVKETIWVEFSEVKERIIFY